MLPCYQFFFLSEAKERKRRSREKAKVRVKEEKQTKVEGKKKVDKNKLTSLCFMNPS